MTVRQLLFDPGEFFASGRDTWVGAGLAVLTLCTLALASLLGPIVVILGTGLDLGIAESFPTVRYAAEEARVVLDGRSLGTLAIVFLAPAPLLAGYAVVFYLLSAPVAERGSFRETLRVTAWGAVPLSLANALTLAGTLAVLPTGIDQLGYAFVTLTGRTITQRADPHILLLLVNLLGIACVCWAAVVWLRGLAHVRGLSDWQAAAVVGVPVAIAVGLNAATVLYGFL